MTSLQSHPVTGLSGGCSVPGDKSVSHRALILGACAIGETRIEGLLDAEDVMATVAALESMGVEVGRDPSGCWRVFGRGVGGLVEPAAVLDLGNSGTGARLLMGVAASLPFATIFTGDRSLSSRPMRRVIEPLSRMGAVFHAREGDRLPVTVLGSSSPLPIAYEAPVASAQVKSAVLLAGLNAPGETTVVEPGPSRDHTERMLADFGAPIRVEALADGGRRVTVRGEAELEARTVVVPKDISSAAFPLVAALITGQSLVRLEGVGVNPLRVGLMETLEEMGACLESTNLRDAGGEPIADLVVASCALRGVVVPAARVPAMIDEVPVLAVAAACASGTTRFEGVGELRVKESDRLRAVARGLEACGVTAEEGPDWLVVHGTGGPPPGGAFIAAEMDHRIAMAFLVLGCAARAPVGVDDGSAIATSFPDFPALMNRLGADIREAAP